MRFENEPYTLPTLRVQSLNIWIIQTTQDIKYDAFLRLTEVGKRISIKNFWGEQIKDLSLIQRCHSTILYQLFSYPRLKSSLVFSMYHWCGCTNQKVLRFFETIRNFLKFCANKLLFMFRYHFFRNKVEKKSETQVLCTRVKCNNFENFCKNILRSLSMDN